MVSTETVRVSSVSRPSISLRWVDKYFYFGMSQLIAGVILYGFGHTVESKLIHGNPRRPILLWVHAFLFSGLVAFYITQSVLVRIRRVKLHRTVGWAGAALGTSMVVVGPWVAVVMARFDSNQLHRANRNAFLIVACPIWSYSRSVLGWRSCGGQIQNSPPDDAHRDVRAYWSRVRQNADDACPFIFL